MAKWTIDCATILPQRATYEGCAGGWSDGRLGQAYDLLQAILSEQHDSNEGVPLLKEAQRLIEEAAA